MKRPMIWAVVPYMLGIAMADTGWFPFWFALATCVAVPALAYALKGFRTVMLMPGCSALVSPTRRFISVKSR